MKKLLKRKKKIAMMLLIIMMSEFISPVSSYALGGGPSQPEVQSFEPIGTSEMVDLSSGSFTYNIPLMDVGGYPINIAYHSGISMDQEASWVGLGWNINPGVINRSMQGIPDDFKGDKIEKEFSMLNNRTYGGNVGIQLELIGNDIDKFGLDLGMNLGVNWNNYVGIGLDFGVSPVFSISDKSGGKMTAGLGLSAGNRSGLTMSPSIGFSASKEIESNKETGNSGLLSFGGSLGASINSRQGMKAMTLGVSASAVEKNNKGGKSDITHSKGFASSNASFSFATPSYTPSISLPFVNRSYSLSGSTGAEVFGTHPGFSLSGFYSVQKLAKKKQATKSYGNLYSYVKNGDRNVLLDFNREKDGAFTLETPNLPLAKKTLDIYSVSGQGTGGSYKVNTSDVGVYHDMYIRNPSTSLSGGIEVGPGVGAHIGADLNAVFSESKVEKWSSDNEMAIRLDFNDFDYNINGEKPYFTQAGEINVDDDALFSNIGAFQAVRPKLYTPNSQSFTVKAKRELVNRNYQPIPGNGQLKRENREKRNQVITPLTADEASSHAIEKKIRNYAHNTFTPASYSTINRVNPIRKGHHLSELRTLRPDGMTYVYGIPAYNNLQEETSFSVDHTRVNHNNGKVAYNPNVDNSKNNILGKEHFYSSTKTPGFAHSYLLTSVLSNDYVDKTFNGPTADDYGSYTKFNYFKAPTTYKWRVPYKRDTANHNPGLLSMNSDDKGNYIYGEKDLWYAHSIESKTQIAEFYTSKRKDAIGVADRNGGMGSGKMYQLDSIKLYSKPDRIMYGPNAVPIKVVHFEYDYSLCKNTPNSNASTKGKLTLTKLWFTYGSSKKGKLSPYEFVYGGQNYDYNWNEYSRWGTYQPAGYGGGGAPESRALNNGDFPYVKQNRNDQNNYATAWNMTNVILPSGGKIKVDYEAGDYAYVQNKNAMYMASIEGMVTEDVLNSANATTTFQSLNENILYDGKQEDEVRNVIVFKLQNPISGSLAHATAIVRSKYMRDIFSGSKNVYFKFMSKITGNTSTTERYEYIPGYANVIDAGVLGVAGSADYTYGYIKLKKECINVFNKGDECPSSCNKCLAHPFAKAAWQFARLYNPMVAYGQSDINESNTAEDVIKQLAALSIKGQIKDMITGFNRKLRNEDFAKQYVKDKSWIRLYEPESNKIGGMARVKRIEIFDSWNEMAGSPNQSFSYGQEYTYTTTNHFGEKISSGVASYEPLTGGDENPFRQDEYKYSEDKRLIPDNRFFQESPMGESLFPGANIIYSEVNVENLNHSNVERTATGKITHKYYTAKDFPTLMDNTRLRKLHKKTPSILSLLNIKSKDYVTASQGYAVINNDMHGKPKMQEVYDENGTIISSVAYEYRTNSDGTLNSTVPVIRPDGNVTPVMVGVDFDMTAASCQSTSNTEGLGMQLNLDAFPLGIFPVAIPMVLPSISSEETRFRSMQLTKNIHQCGILDKVIATDHGASVSTDNLAWDAETGEVLTTRTYNEFKDPIFSQKIPAHWAYEGMKPAYQNVLASFKFNISNGTATPDAVLASQYNNWFDFFHVGDELMVVSGVCKSGCTNQIVNKVWIKDKKTSPKRLYLIDKDGNPVEQGTSAVVELKVLRSGHRNLQSTAVASTTSLSNPIVAGRLDITENTKVIDANAVEFDDHWQSYCCVDKEPEPIGKYSLVDIVKYTSSNSNNKIEGIVINGIGTITFPNGPINIVSSSSFNYQIDPTRIGEMKSAITNFFTNLGHQPSNVEIISYGYGMGRRSVMHIKINICANGLDYDGQMNFSRTEGGNNYSIGLDPKYIGNCIDTFQCQKYINPYRTNNKGVYRPLKTWLHLANREKGQGNPSGTNVRKDGPYSTFSSFWDNAPSATELMSIDNSDWIWSSMITKFTPSGSEIENRDKLDRYSAETLGYGGHLVTAVGANTKYRQMAFDGFEDYHYEKNLGINGDVCAMPKHFRLISNNSIENLISGDAVHSGKYSLKLWRQSLTTNFVVSNGEPIDNGHQEFVPFIQDDYDCLPVFSPDENTKYVISTWVKSYEGIGAYTYVYPKVSIEMAGVVTDFVASGPIIEGWQRIYGEFNIPAGATDLKLTMASGGHIVFFDDLRIHPFLASFKSYVYDDISLKLMAELDDNNFATFYEYDGSGALERIKKETIKGISTIQEVRFANPKK